MGGWDIVQGFLLIRDGATSKLKRAVEKKKDCNDFEVVANAPTWPGLDLAAMVSRANSQ